MTRRRILRPAAVAAALLALGGCGVPLQESAQPVDGVVIGTPTPSAPPSGREVRYWFVSDGVLVPVAEKVAEPVTVDALIGGLAAGPGEDAPGMRSLVVDPSGGGPLLTAPPPDEPVTAGATVTVQLADAFASLPGSEQLLLLGQVVMTLTSAGAEGVLITDTQGAPVTVPLPDGRVLEGPATRADYAPLTKAPTSPAG